MPTYAAIDIGSNSCRLAIADVQRRGLRLLHQDREVVRLGESVFETRMISPDAMANTIRALKRFQKAVQEHVCDRVRVVATSAMRDARNAAAFTAWVKSTTGWDVEVISGLEEGRLIHLGVVTHEPGARGRCLLIDLGGGSCEVTLSEGGRIREVVSLPLGAVRLQQEFLRSDPPEKEDLHRLHHFIERELRKVDKRFREVRIPLVIATSGTASALAEAANVPPAWIAGKRPAKKATKSSPKKRVKTLAPLEATTVDVKRLANKLVKMTNTQRMTVPGIGPRRSDIIIGGALVYAALMERLNLKSFRYSPLGLRDGILQQMLADSDTHGSAHQAMEKERWQSVIEIAHRYGVEEKQSEAVRGDALKLFDLLKPVHKLPEEYRFWLQGASALYEIGKFMNHQGHHRHTQYIIAHSEIYGFSPVQRAIVGAIARYLGKSRPESGDRPMRAIPVEEHARIKAAVVLLRLAIALNQDRANEQLRLRAAIYPRRVVLQLRELRGNAELEIWSARKEAAYFREVFRRELLVELA
ncbi:MAG: Ppx/GppA family phosphatase [Acidobacteria bacterium]|nr:Ppx/GppA family phosphatase [Acidobacteriota bacterium]